MEKVGTYSARELLRWAPHLSPERRNALEHLTAKERDDLRSLSKQMDREFGRKRAPRLLLILLAVLAVCSLTGLSYDMQTLVLAPLVPVLIYLDIRLVRGKHGPTFFALLDEFKYAKEERKTRRGEVVSDTGAKHVS